MLGSEVCDLTGADLGVSRSKRLGVTGWDSVIEGFSWNVCSGEGGAEVEGAGLSCCGRMAKTSSPFSSSSGKGDSVSLAMAGRFTCDDEAWDDCDCDDCCWRGGGIGK